MLRRSWIQSAVSLVVLLAPSAAAAQGIESNRTPLRTALNEIATVRSEYADAFARNDVGALAGVYTADAVIITGDGAMSSGAEQIRGLLDQQVARIGKVAISSDTVRVYGRTAVDIGRIVAQHVAVLRKGMRGWKLAHVVTIPAGAGGRVAVQ
jgi:uncharacterized protein (TIGR02246 family)